MNTYRHVSASILIFFLVAASACAGPDGAGELSEESAAPEGASVEPNGDERVANTALALSSNELSVLLTGKSLPITQGYLPNGTHAGIDFGSTGDGVTSVFAPLNGQVVANTSVCGKVAIFDGSNTVIMAHMTALAALPVGSSVVTGTYLGKASKVIGGDCQATGAHLHIEIRTGNHPIMAAPKANNTSTTRNPLDYPYGPFPPVSLLSPSPGTLALGNPVTFSWSPIQGATTYRLQLSAQNIFDGNTCTGAGGCLVNSTTGGTKMPLYLSPGNYYWRVRAGSAYSGGIFSSARMVAK